MCASATCGAHRERDAIFTSERNGGETGGDPGCLLELRELLAEAHRSALVDDEHEAEWRFVGDETDEEALETRIRVPCNTTWIISEIVRAKVDRLDPAADPAGAASSIPTCLGDLPRDERKPPETGSELR